MRYGMARRRHGRELRNDIQRIGRRHYSNGRVSIDNQPLLSRACAMAAQAVLILIDRRSQHRHSIERADSTYTCLGRTQRRRRSKLYCLVRGMRIVAIDAGSVTVVI